MSDLTLEEINRQYRALVHRQSLLLSSFVILMAAIIALISADAAPYLTAWFLISAAVIICLWDSFLSWRAA